MKIRTVTVHDRVLNVHLECKFWECLDEIIESLGTTLQGLVGHLRSSRPDDLASDLRVFVLQHYQRQANSDFSEMISPSSVGHKHH